MQPYDIQIEYKAGKTNVIADTLSRPPCEDNHNRSKCEIYAFSIELPRKNSNEIRNDQSNDPQLKNIIHCLESKTEDQAYWMKRGYVMSDGVLYCYDNEDSDDAQLVIPTKKREQILKYYHNDDTAVHYGIERIMRNITARHHWPGIRRDIEKHFKECMECQRHKST